MYICLRTPSWANILIARVNCMYNVLMLCRLGDFVLRIYSVLRHFQYCYWCRVPWLYLLPWKDFAKICGQWMHCPVISPLNGLGRCKILPFCEGHRDEDEEVLVCPSYSGFAVVVRNFSGKLYLIRITHFGVVSNACISLNLATVLSRLIVGCMASLVIPQVKFNCPACISICPRIWLLFPSMEVSLIVLLIRRSVNIVEYLCDSLTILRL